MNQDRRETSRDFSNAGELNRVLFEEAADGIFITDPRGRYVAVNPRATELTGYSREELLAMTVADLIPPEDLARDQLRTDDPRQGGVATNEWNIRRKDGSLLPVEVRSRMLPEGNLLGIARDITQRRRAEAMRDQRARELAALQALGIAVGASLSIEQTTAAALWGMLEAVQPDLTFLFLRDGEKLVLQDVLPEEGRRLLGAIPDHLVGECLCGLAVLKGRLIYSRDIHTDPRCTWEECKLAGIRSFAALPLRSGEEIIGVIGLASMTERDFETQAGFLETLAGQVSVALTNARLYESARRELTERERADTELRASEEHYRRLADRAPDAIYRMSLPDGNYRYVSPSATVIFGYTPEEFYSNPSLVEKIFHPDWIPYFKEQWDRLLKGDVPPTYEYKIIHKSGDIRWLNQRNMLITGADGRPVAIEGIVTDVTDRKRAEEALREATTKLENTLESISDSFFSMDDNLVVTYFNAAAERMLNRKAPEVIGQYLFDVFSEARGSIFEEKYRQAVAEKVFVTFECHFDVAPYRNWYDVRVYPRENGISVYFQIITKRKLAEAAAQAEKEKYRLLVRQVPGIVFKGYADYGLECFDDKIETLTGYTQDEFNSRAVKWNDVVLEECLVPVREQLKKALKSDGFYVSEYRIRKKSGELVWVQARNQVVWNAQGGMDYISGVFFDITEHKLAQEAIARERALSDHIINSLPGVFYMFDERGNLVRWNTKHEEVTGYSRDELLGMHVLDFFSEAHKNLIDSRVKSVFAEGEAFAEAPLLTKGGEQIPYFFTGRLTVLDGRQYLIGVGVDITERKRFEEALEKRMVALTRPLDDAEGITFEELFNLDDLQRLQDEFARATRVASIITHPDGTPITAPSNFCRLCSDIIRKTDKGRANCYRSDAVIGLPSDKGPTIQPCMSGGFLDAGAGISVGGRHIANWLIGQVRNETQTEEKMRAYAREIGADEAAAVEAFLEVPTMSFEQFEQVAQALFTLANQLSATAYQNVQQARFITERKRAEEEKDALQAKLVQAQKMESVGRLAGGVAHDFNNMLSAILGHAELAMMRSNPSEPIHAHLKAIERSALRSADLIRQLLAFARRQTVAPKVLDLNESVTGMLKMLLRLIGEDIDLVWVPGADLWPVKIDPSQIDQLLANLFVNARDAIAGVGKVTIETENIAFDEAYCDVHPGFIPGEYVMLAVSDDGCGIDKDVIDHLFEPFFTTKEMGKGTGLGLATVYGIVKQNEGFINVYSEPDKGSTFKIYLPRFAGEVVESMEAKAAEMPKGRGETVLLVEDEAVILNVGRTMLEELGYKVLTADAPAEALRQAMAHAGEIRLLITDVVMPEMNGRRLAKLISDIKPGLKCLFISGYTANVIAHRGVLDEGVNFLQKPFSTKDLAAKVREVLESE